jgi:hypothetical protein
MYRDSGSSCEFSAGELKTFFKLWSEEDAIAFVKSLPPGHNLTFPDFYADHFPRAYALAKERMISNSRFAEKR